MLSTEFPINYTSIKRCRV